MSIRIIGYSADEEAYFRHGGKKPKRKHYRTTQAQLLKKNIKPGQFKCCYCGISLDQLNYTREHLIPLIRGGSNRLTNLKPCCSDCNLEKGDLMPASYLEWLVLNDSQKVQRVRQLFTDKGFI